MHSKGKGFEWAWKPADTRVGFERLLGELQFELWIGDAAEIRTKRVRKQKTDRQDAQLLLRLRIEDRVLGTIPDTADIVRDGDFPLITEILKGGAANPRKASVAARSDGVRLFHINRYVHPRMDAALEVMLAFREPGNFKLTALQNSCPSHGDARKSGFAFGDSGLSSIKPLDKTAAEFLYLGESVWLAPLIHHSKDGSLVDMDGIGLKVPLRIRFPVHGLLNQVVERGLISQSDVLAEISSQHRIEGRWIAFVQRDNLSDSWWICGHGLGMCLPLRKDVGCGSCKTDGQADDKKPAEKVVH